MVFYMIVAVDAALLFIVQSVMKSARMAHGKPFKRHARGYVVLAVAYGISLLSGVFYKLALAVSVFYLVIILALIVFGIIWTALKAFRGLTE